MNYVEKEKEILTEQNKNLSKSNKNLTEKVKSFSDYSTTKNENMYFKDKISSLEKDAASLRIHNVNLQKSNEKLVDKLNEEIKRCEDLKLEVNCDFILAC